jgi:hypothetical protein
MILMISYPSVVPQGYTMHRMRKETAINGMLITWLNLSLIKKISNLLRDMCKHARELS